MANPSATWEALGGQASDEGDQQVFYRRQELYTLLWSVRDLSDYRIASARNGGPIALIRDDRKPVLLQQQQSAALVRPNTINVFSAAGALIKTITWDTSSSSSSNRIISIGWTGDEKLVVLTEEGSFRLYDLSSSTTTSKTSVGGAQYTQHSLGSEAAESGVVEAIVHEEGLVALLSTNVFIELKEATSAWESTKLVRLANIGSALQQERIHSWTVIKASSTNTRTTEVLFAANDTVYRLDEIDCTDTRFNRGPFSSIEPSPSGRFLSLISSKTSTLFVTSIDFQRSLSEFDLAKESVHTEPTQAWSGDNTVVVASDRKVVMVGPFGECLRYVYSDPIHLVGELDGCRILSSSVSHFLQIVPQATQDVFRPGSTSPSAILYTASELYAQKSPKADDYLRSIRDKLSEAIEACLNAASREWDIDSQKRLLKAASFGKSYVDNFNPSEYVSVGRTLRILNAVRYYEVGIPLSWDQYASGTPNDLINKLLNRSLHLLALRISEALSLPTAPVISHWALSLIRSSTSIGEDELTEKIVSRLGDQESVSSADIALSAYQNGKASLARKLLDREERVELVPPVALVMNDDELALSRALDTGDTNLVYQVLIDMRQRRGVGDFLRFVSRKREGYALLECYAKENDRALLKDLYFQDDRRKEMALLSIDEALACPDVGDRLVKLRDAYRSFDEDKDCTFEAKMTDEQIRLLTLQESLESEATGSTTTGQRFLGLSVNETIRSLLTSGDPALRKRVDKIRSDFKVPDKRYYHVALKALVSIGDWDALWTLATSKRGSSTSSSPIGYEPFVHALLEAGAQRQAVRYVEKCDSKERIELYVKCGEWVVAGQECVRRGERGKLMELRERVPNNVIRTQLDGLLDQLGGPVAR